MFKFFVVAFFALMAVVAAKPKPAVIAYSAPLVAAGGLEYSREYHGNFGHQYVAASPYVASPYVASPYAAYTAAYTAPVLLR